MARSRYPQTSTGRMWAELSVDDPGHGRLIIRRLDDRYDNDEPFDEYGTYAGPQLADLLRVVTELALGLDDRPTVRLPASRGLAIIIEGSDAAGLLPILQQAIVLATAGEDRYVRTWPDDPQISLEPLCVHCNQGSDTSHTVTISAWCSDYGHTPYGVSAHLDWTQAERRHYALKLRRHTRALAARSEPSPDSQ